MLFLRGASLSVIVTVNCVPGSRVDAAVFALAAPRCTVERSWVLSVCTDLSAVTLSAAECTMYNAQWHPGTVAHGRQRKAVT